MIRSDFELFCYSLVLLKLAFLIIMINDNDNDMTFFENIVYLLRALRSGRK